MPEQRFDAVVIGAGPGGYPAAIRLGLLAGHYRSDRYWSDAVLGEAQSRLAHWRAATALPAGPDAADVIARVRQYLADDLDTPKAIAALDGWSTDALEYGGHDTDADSVMPAIAGCDRIRAALGCSVVIVAHVGLVAPVLTSAIIDADTEPPTQPPVDVAIEADDSTED